MFGREIRATQTIKTALSSTQLMELWVREFPRDRGNPSINGDAVEVHGIGKKQQVLMVFRFADATSNPEVSCVLRKASPLWSVLCAVVLGLVVASFRFWLGVLLAVAFISTEFWSRKTEPAAFLRALQRIAASETAPTERAT